jgi:hypothetical protein
MDLRLSGIFGDSDFAESQGHLGSRRHASPQGLSLEHFWGTLSGILRMGNLRTPP